jgi:Zn-dependent M28 family amino/carboxypeptidase
MSKRFILILAAVGVAAIIILPNVRALADGILYLRDAVTYNPQAVTPVNPAGRYASLYDLVRLRNAERLLYLRHTLNLPNISLTEIPISNSLFSNLLVRFNHSNAPLTIFSAHYDKLYDNPDYQGASDNTAAVSTLLASVTELARRGYVGNRAFLFSGEEETGLRGAAAFIDYARAHNLAIREIINFDNIGRGRLAIRPSAQKPGFVFTLPFAGDWAYDGRTIAASSAYPPANASLVQALWRVQPGIVVYERFTALSDSNVFQQNSIDTVCLSSDNMFYLEQTWHTYADRVELIDERNLDLAYDLILNYGDTK